MCRQAEQNLQRRLDVLDEESLQAATTAKQEP